MDDLQTAAGAPQPGPWPATTTTVTVPAHADFVASIRALVRSTAVVADLAFEDVEELQIAVNEAAALLLPVVTPTEPTLSARLDVVPGQLQVRLSVAGRDGAGVDRGSLAWMMLSTLSPDLQVDEVDGVHAIALSRTRSEKPRA